MDVKPLVKGLLARNREVLESTMADVENEHAHWAPSGKALPLGALDRSAFSERKALQLRSVLP